MRKSITAASLVALATVLVTVPTPRSAANEDPNPKGTKKLEKNSDKDLRGVTRLFAKTAKKGVKEKVKLLNALTKSLKQGKEKASEAEATAIAEQALQLLADCQDEIMSLVHDAYDSGSSSSAVGSFLESPSPRAFGGTSGAVGEFPDDLAAGWSKALVPLVKAMRKLQSSLADCNVLLSFTNRAPAPLNPLSAGQPLAGPYVLGTGSISDGNVFAIVTRASEDGSGPFSEYGVGLYSQSGLQGGLVPTTPQDQSLAILWTQSDSSMDRFAPSYSGPPGTGRFTPERTRNEPLNVVFYRTIDNTDGGTNVDLSSAGWVSVTGPCETPVDPDRVALDGTFSVIPSASDSVLNTTALDRNNKTKNSNDDLAERFAEDFIDALFVQLAKVPEQSGKLARLDADVFPCGQGPNGFTVCANIPTPDPGGELIVLGVAFAADIPLNDPTNLLQYGFVFDQDGNTANNYVPIPQFKNDYFGGSDKWYAVEYSPVGGWELKVTDARGGGFVPVASAARAVIRGNSIVLAVPASEFAVAAPSYRISSFRHTGDFGQNPPFDWTADYDPAPGKPLRTFGE